MKLALTFHPDQLVSSDTFEQIRYHVAPFKCLGTAEHSYTVLHTRLHQYSGYASRC